MSFTLRNFPSSSETRVISSVPSSIELLLPLKSNRCASSFCACWMAFATSCISVLETMSNENSCAMAFSLLLHDLHPGRGRETEEIRGHRAAVDGGEVEGGLIALAV